MKITDILPELYNLSYFKYVHGERKYSRLSLEKTQYSYRFITVGEGRLTVSCAGRTEEMCAGDILYLLPGESYRINPSKSDFSLYSAYFDFRESMGDKAQKGQCIFMNNYDRSLCSERIAFEDAEALNQSGFFKGADRHRRLDELKHCDKGGALFLGVNKTVIKAHGSAKRSAIKGAILQAVLYSESGVANAIKDKLAGEEIVIEQ